MVQSRDFGEARTQCSAPRVTAARGPSSPAGVHDHHEFVPLGAVPDGQLDLPQRRLAQGRPTGEAKHKVNALLRTEGRVSLARKEPHCPWTEQSLNFGLSINQLNAQFKQGFHVT